MTHEVGQCWTPMADLDEAVPAGSACLDDDRALALVDGQLSMEARAEIEAHLDVCASCRRFVSELAKESLFQGPTELPTDLERTGYAPGRPGVLDVALTVRDLAETRPAIDATLPAPPVVAPRRDEPPRPHRAGPTSTPPPASPASSPAGGAAPVAAPQASGVDTSSIVIVALSLSLSILTVFAALTGLAALGYAFLSR